MGWRKKHLLMRTIMQFIVGYAVGRVVTIAVLIVIGLLIAGAHGSEHHPVAAQQAIEARQHEEVQREAEEEAEREVGYAAKPGPPYPVQTFTP